MSAALTSQENVLLITNRCNRVTKIPVLNIPDTATDEDGDLRFDIATSKGVVEVRNWGKWRFVCRGTAAALARARLIQVDWCPGLPGNNKRRQTVIFRDDGPHLELAMGRALKEPHIAIVRVSAKTFEVNIPPTSEQCGRLEALCDRNRSKWMEAQNAKAIQEAEKAEEKHKADLLARTKAEVRADALKAFAFASEVLLGNLNNGGPAYDDEVMTYIQFSLRSIQNQIIEGKLSEPLKPYVTEGNLIRLQIKRKGGTDAEIF